MICFWFWGVFFFILLVKWNLINIPLRWYETPCNIYNDERMLKSVENYGFKNFEIPKNAFIKIDKRDEK